MARKLRPALEIVSGIGALGFDLQHHDSTQIAHAVAVLRTVNPELFSWLVQALGVTPTEVSAEILSDGEGRKIQRATNSSSLEDPTDPPALAGRPVPHQRQENQENEDVTARTADAGTPPTSSSPPRPSTE